MDTLRIQYEHQVSSLQRQLEAERRSNQEQTRLKHQQYEELVGDLRAVLGKDEQSTLDSALARLSHAHTGEIKRLQAEHQNDICLELTALKLSLEQVYSSKAEMEAQESKQRFDQRLEALNKQLTSLRSAPATHTHETDSLSDQYNQLVKRISLGLEQQFPSDKPLINHNGLNGDGGQESEDNLSPASYRPQEIHTLLQSQQAQIAALRDKVQKEELSPLRNGGTTEVAELEQQLADLHKQYQAQVEQIQTSITTKDEQQQRELAEYREQLEKQHEELKSQYEKRIQDMETSFEHEISNIKEKYEAQLSGLIHSKLSTNKDSDFSVDSSQDKDRALPTDLNTPQQRSYVHKTTALTAISDIDSDMSADASRTDDYPARIKMLEVELLERDAQLKELEARLGSQDKSAPSEMETELSDLRQKVTQLQQDASTALSRCLELQAFLEQRDKELQQLQAENKDLNVLLEGKNTKISQLEAEKAESEKLYRDLLERESPRSKGSHGRDVPSGSSVDDSFASARDSVHNTPRSYVSDHLEFTSPRSDVGDDDNKLHSNNSNSNTRELNDSIPFANDSTDYPSSNGNNNNNNNNSNSAALEVAVEDLKRKVEELDNQLSSAKERERQLKLQLEEVEHHNDEAIEMLKQELEHERKMEVETLQSEFRVQLEVELKRQAAQLLPKDSAVSEESTVSSSVQEVQASAAKLDCFSTNNNANPVEEALVQQCVEDVLTSDAHVDALLQTSGFELQQTVQASSKAAASEDRDGDDAEDFVEGARDINRTENLSDDSKASSPPLGALSPVHSSTPMAKMRAQAEPLTDIEKEMEALRQEYEEKFARLKAERDDAEERYDRLLQGVQSGDHPQLNELMKDKYDEELELMKSLIQQDFDAQLKEEKKKFVEKHRKLMTDFMADREKEEEESNKKHAEELEELRDTLNREFEERLSAYEQENIRLSRDLDLLRDVSQEDKEEGTPSNDSTLPEIDEITLTFQQQLSDVQQTGPPSSEAGEGMDTSTPVKRPESGEGMDTSTPVKRPESVETGVQYDYEESEDETEAERAPTRQLRSFADVVKSPSPQSAQDMEFTIQQLTAQVERLTSQLAQQQQQDGAKTPTRSPQHSPENETLKEEDSALVAMLQSDLERISAERESVQRTNDRLLSLLSDSVKTYVGVEDTINRKLSVVVSGATPRPASHQSGAGETSGGGAGSRPTSRPTSRPGSVETVPNQGREDSPAMDRKGATPDADTSQDSHHLENTSILSNATDEGLEISQRLAESIFVGPDLDAEGEEILTDARSRLTTAVGQLLELMERSTVQLMEAKATQQELLDTLAARGQELESTSSRTAELDSQLAAEIQAKDYLGLELHKAEGLIAGYSAERESLESQLKNLEEQREALIVDLDATRSRLEEFERSQTEMESARQDLGRQQELLRDNAGQEMQVEEQPSLSPPGDATPPGLCGSGWGSTLLKEVDSLNQEKRELADQLQHQLDLSRRRLTELEALAEDAERRHEAQLDERVKQVEDLRLQLDNTERQLKASKAFVDEQMAEREQEREEHQREVERLQELMQGKDKNANSQQRLQTEIADLTEQLQARMTSQTSMHQRTLELQRALEDKELSAHDLKAWVAQLETELDQRGSVEEQLKQRISRLESQLTQQQSEEDSQAANDSSHTEPSSDAGKTRRGDSPSTLSPSRKPWTSQVSLEEEVLRSQKNEEELQQENTVLKEQVQQQMLQISGLRNQLDQLRHYGGGEADEDVAQLRTRLQTERDALERSEAQAAEAQNKVEKLEGLLKAKEEEAENVRSKVSKILEMGDTQEENQNLKIQLDELQGQVSQLSSMSSLPALPAELLQEKNSEIEELRQKIQDQETQQQAQVQELQTRLKERDEEISDLQDNITSLRRGEPCLDVSLPFNEDAEKVLNISMTGRTSIQQELEDTMQEREGEIATLLQEVEDLKRKLSAKEEDINSAKSDKERVSSLEEAVQQKESEIYELTCEVEELRQQTQDKEQEITQISEERDKAQEQLHEKEARLDQMLLQIDSLQEEISSLTTFQLELQKDFDTVQSMLDDKEKEIESLTKELTDSKTQQETLDTVLQLEKVVASLQKELREKQNVVEEKEEELYELRDKLEEMEKVGEEVTSLKAEVTSKTQLLQEEQKSAEESQKALEKEREDLEDLKKATVLEQESKEKHIASMQESMDEKDTKIKDQETKIESLEKGMKEMQEKSQKETASLLEALEKSAADYEKRIVSIEAQLKTQSDNFSALQAAADHGKSIESKVELLNQEIQEKESALESLQNKLLQSAEQHEALVEDLKQQLVTKDKDHEKILKDIKNEHEKTMQELKNDHEKLVAELKSYHEKAIGNLKSDLVSREEDLQDVRRLLKETEEQLRLRQSALLDAHAEKDQLAQNSELLGKLKQTLEEKNQNIAELEGQLRFRQSCILDMEAERERVLEERDDFEAELRQDLEEKEKALQDMQDKYTRLKEGLGEEVLHMEQEIQRSSQARVLKTSPGEPDSQGEEGALASDSAEKLQDKLSQVTEELSSLKSKKSEVEERLAQTNLQLGEREDQLQQLQAEMQQQVEQAQDLQNKISQMEISLKEAKARAAAESARLAESQAHALGLETKLEQAQQTQSPHEIDSADVVENKVSMDQVKEMSEKHQKDLAEKEHELRTMKQDLEKWVEVAADHSNLQHLLKEKEGQAQSLKTEMDSLREEIERKETTVSLLRQQLLSRDEELADAQEQLFLVRTGKDQTPSIASRHQDDGGESLSPETKQSISHLKTQLRKAHAALEELRTGGEGTGETEEELDRLRQELKQKEKELTILRSRFSGDELNTVKTLQDIRDDHSRELAQLQDEHNQDVRQLRKVQERKLEQALEELRQALEKEHKTELNNMKAQYQAESLALGAQSNISTGEESSRSSFASDDSLLPQRLQALLKRLNSLGEHLLSVSDLEYLQQHLTPEARPQSDTSAWSSERRSLMDQIDALKDLLQQADRVAKQGDEDKSDWRSDLLQALVSVYEKERRVLQAEINTADSMFPEVDIITQLEARLHDLEQVHQSGLDDMLSADRQSLLDEVDSLHHQLLDARAQLQDAKDSLDQRISQLEDAKSTAEWKLQRQIELLEYKLQQEAVVQEDLRKSLRLERGRVSELSQQSSRERAHTLELQGELSETQIGLSKARDALEREQQRFSSVTELRDQRNRLDAEAVSKLTQLLDEERESHQTALEQEKELIRQLRREADRVRSNHSQQMRQVESENAAKLEALRQELANTRSELSERLRRAEELELQEEVSSRKLQRAAEKDKEELRLKVAQLERELAQVQNRARELEMELETQNMRTQQSLDSVDARARQGHREAVVTLLTASVVDQELKYKLGQCCNKLQTLARQLQEMTVQHQSRSRHGQDGFTDSDLAGVMAELNKLKEEIKDRESSVADEKVQNSSNDSERVAELVKHNQQLAERVLRLRQDKDHLTNSLELLESRLNANVGQGKKEKVASLPTYVSDVTSDEETVYDRTVWASERLSLQMALDSAEHEIQRLRDELQHFRKFMNAEGQLVTVDHEKTTRLYGKFLRAESFRKALVYQKKYLLLLLGGYRDTEQETLAILASMGGFPSPGVGLSFHGRHSRAFTVFRSAGRTVIAIFRMKYLVRKWKRATRVGSPVMTGQITHQHGYVPSSSSFPTHQRHPGGGTATTTTTQRPHRHQRPPTTMTAAAATSMLNYPNSNNSNSSSNSIGHVSSLSNGGGVSSLYTGAARSSSLNYTTPPTKDSSKHARSAPRGNREDARRRILQDEIPSSPRQPSSARSRQVENDDDNFLHYLEKVKEQLSDRDYGTPSPSGRRSGWR
ncbi:A-kinase anchor protein 9 [Elysia marginata]|uniref:A-kinase anchor protein 9 n=1 Tax=Elysia marginata TaxID=1093978 RepID=A0AAV4JK07_9GAST|nr:A-kinase anchor protein 9 [Elysia marginata]